MSDIEARIRAALDDVHIESGRKDEHEAVVQRVLQAARQAPASGEMEKDEAITDFYANNRRSGYTHPPAKVPEGWQIHAKVNMPAPDNAGQRIVGYRVTLPDSAGLSGVCDNLPSLTTAPPATTQAKVPEVPTEEMLDEGVTALIRGLKTFKGNYTQVVNNIWEDMAAALLTTPTPATTPETEWVKCEDRLPEDESTVLAYTKDYADPMVVPARYSPNSEQWFDVEYVDRDGDQNTLYQVISWMPLPTPPQEQ